MDRRESIRSFILGSVAGGLALHGCNPTGEKEVDDEILAKATHHFGRTPEEKELIEKLNAEQFFNEHEMRTVAVLCDLILPANEQFGGATDAEVPDFIEFMAKDIPELQITLRGGLMWLDHKCNTEFLTNFVGSTEAQQKEILDTIALSLIHI